jgi:hypothetical protein
MPSLIIRRPILPHLEVFDGFAALLCGKPLAFRRDAPLLSRLRLDKVGKAQPW